MARAYSVGLAADSAVHDRLRVARHRQARPERKCDSKIERPGLARVGIDPI